MDIRIAPAVPPPTPAHQGREGGTVQKPSESGKLTTHTRQTEALLPSQLSPAGQGAGKQDVTGKGQEQSRLAEEVRDMAEKATAYMRRAETHLQFVVSEQTGRIKINVIDSETQEVIRQIPPESMMRFAERVTQMKGLLFDTRG